MRAFALAALGLLVATPVASGAPVPFGANVDGVSANDNPATTCAQAPPGLFFPTGSQSCMWSDLGLTAPATGTVTGVRVKVGATTGPMRVNVIRYLFRQTGDTAHPFSAGPFLEAYGPTFTPAANTTTSVAANLPMQEDPTPALSDLQTIQVIDVLALEVLASNVPIPMVQSNLNTSVGVYPGPTAAAVPAPSPAGIPGSYLTFGWSVLMNADLETAGGGGGGGGAPNGGGGGGTAAVPTIALPNRTVGVRDGRVRIPLTCQGAECAGVINLLRAAGAAAKKAKPVSYGSAKFEIKAGGHKTVSIRLTAAGRSLLKRSAKPKVRARVTFTKGGGKTASFSLTLKR